VVINEAPGKRISLTTDASTAIDDGFTACVVPGPGRIEVRSDLPGLAPPA